jgi:hypothetical protein
LRFTLGIGVVAEKTTLKSLARTVVLGIVWGVVFSGITVILVRIFHFAEHLWVRMGIS